jgi:hypothetical protein
MGYNFLFRSVLLLGLPLALTGCLTSGAFLSGHVTDVQLSKANYAIIATDVHGSATAGYLFGVSASMGMSASTFGLVRVQGDGRLYQAALADLWDNVEAEYGEINGQSLALVNVRYDVDALNLLVYTHPTLTVRADVVAFTE